MSIYSILEHHLDKVVKAACNEKAC